MSLAVENYLRKESLRSAKTSTFSNFVFDVPGGKLMRSFV